ADDRCARHVPHHSTMIDDPELDVSPLTVHELVWERDSIIAMLTDPAAPPPGPLTASRMRGDQLAPDLVHLTFDTESKGLRSHRSSLWRLTASGWLLWFHQATPFVDDPFAEV
ncbi:hypothetical protein ACFWZ8_21915, partial [[Kitasatospora] papulosa]